MLVIQMYTNTSLNIHLACNDKSRKFATYELINLAGEKEYTLIWKKTKFYEMPVGDISRLCIYVFCSFAKPFTKGGVGRIATVYKKILYRECTDGTFKQEIPHPRHLGILGPVVRGEVGDTIKVHFKNFAKRPITLHPHGVLYSKANEGAIYADQSNTDQKRDDSVQPNQVQVYTWFVNEEHAPTAADEDCVTRMYHSHVISSQDVNTGLIGNDEPFFTLECIVVCKQCNFFFSFFFRPIADLQTRSSNRK